MNKIFAFLLLCSTFLILPAQNSNVRKNIRSGNRAYRADQYEKAEVKYRRAIHQDSAAYRAHHNLGNTLYRKKNYTEAAKQYEQAMAEPSLDKNTRSNMLHNKGNCHLESGLQKADRAQGLEDFRQAVSDYQEALKLNPKNDDTRYNLSYAMKMLQQAQQQQQQQQGGNDKQEQQDKQDQQNQQSQQQQQDQQDQQRQNQQNQQQQQRQQDNRQQQQKKQDAERLLEAVKNNEKNTLKENAKKLDAGTPQRIEKDW